MTEYTDEYLKKIFEESSSQNEVLRKLGLKINGGNQRLVKKLAKQINLDLNEYGNNKTNLTKERYRENPKYCKCCGKKLTFKQRMNDFCSHSCSAKVNNLERIHTLETRKKISETLQKKNLNDNGEVKEYTFNKECLNCGKKLSLKQRHNKFCCHECSAQYYYKTQVEKWLNGENFIRGAHQTPNFIRKYLMELHDNKCEKCGWGEEHQVTHTIPLEIHHIDGDCTNNTFENLQLLCPNCHSLTENFGSLNKNSKRFHRSKKRK